MLAEYAPDDGRVLAGGQSLVPTMAFRLARPHHLIDINGIAALDRIAVENDRLVIGAGVRHQAFRRPVVAGPLGELLSAVMHHIAHYPIRTRGTFCGSVAHADPASEWCLVAATLGAEMVARSTRGIRVIAAEDYFQGIMTTALEPDELLAEVRLPLLPATTRWGFYEFNRRAGDFALGMALVTYDVANGVIAMPRVGVGGAEAHARRMRGSRGAARRCAARRCHLHRGRRCGGRCHRSPDGRTDRRDLSPGARRRRDPSRARASGGAGSVSRGTRARKARCPPWRSATAGMYVG